MEPNPYQTPASDGGSASPRVSATVSRVQWTFTQIVLWGAWLLLVELSGFAGLALGLLFCIFFPMHDGQRIWALTPIGLTLSLLIGFLFAGAAGTCLVVYWNKPRRTPKYREQEEDG
jgi:hypothetical protein